MDVTNFVQAGAVTIANLSGTPTSLITWGADGLAFRTTGNQVFLIRTILADDRNNDGLPDSWQMQYFGSLTAPGSGPNDDPDHDGMNNYQEYIAGTDPTNAASVLRLTNVRPQGNSVQLSWQGGTNVYYRIQRTQTLNPSNWQDIYTNPPSAVATGTFTDVLAPSGSTYYRIKVGLQ